MGGFCRTMGPGFLQGEGTTLFAGTWDHPPEASVGHEVSDREMNQVSIRRRRGKPSGGNHVLPGANHADPRTRLLIPEPG